MVRNERLSKRIQLICETCKDKFLVYPYRMKDKPRFCSHSCRNKAFVGSKAFHWKGGIKHHVEGYIEIYSPDHPNKTKCGYVFQHRLVIERSIGRYLLPEERVHHINGKKDDNRLRNLKLLSNESEHQKLHWREKRASSV